MDCIEFENCRSICLFKYLSVDARLASLQEGILGCTPHRSLEPPPVSHAAGKTAVHSRLHACSLVSGVPGARARPDACDELTIEWRTPAGACRAEPSLVMCPIHREKGSGFQETI